MIWRKREIMVYYTVDGIEGNAGFYVRGKMTLASLDKIRSSIAEDIKTKGNVIIHNIIEIK